ncbi:MAG: alpha/beta hydrolase-fold protein [Colwellia sp.]
MQKYLKIVLMSFVFYLSNVSAESPSDTVKPLKSYQIPGSVVHEVDSEIVGQTYELAIAFPGSYGQKPEKTYPVVYVLDAQWNFAMISSIMGKLNYDGTVSEAIVVGITWGGEGADANVLRGRDFTPTPFAHIPNSGGGKKFLTALEKELIPFIEKNYRNNEQRIITGSSLSGMFVSYALLEKPALFNKYVASAPAYHTVPQKFFDEKIAKLADKKLSENTRILIVCGEFDICGERSKNFVGQLSALKLSNLSVTYKPIEGVGHAGVEAIAYTYGLQDAFKRPFFAVSDSVLKKYAGTYVMQDGYSVEVSVENNVLKTRQQDGQEANWLAESENKFYIYGTKMEAEFLPTQEGKYVFEVTAQGNKFLLTQTNKK